MWKIYAVKSIYRTETTGKAYSVGDGFSDEFDMIEERIVTVKARSFDEAIERVEKAAAEYAATPFTNPFGQTVQWKYTGSSDVYEPYDSIPADLEVYSNTYLISRALSDEELADNVLGRSFENEDDLRMNFLDSDIVGFR
jgi:hypothetical protein